MPSPNKPSGKPPEKPPGKPPEKPPGKPPKKEHKMFEVRVYLLVSSYSVELELLTTIDFSCKDMFTDSGRAIVLAKKSIEEYVRNIGLFGITVEDPEGAFSYYPPQRIGKIEYGEVDR